MEEIGIREAVTRALRSMPGLAQMEEETTENQVGSLLKPFNSFKQE
jgi:hypothetical protein